MNAIQGTSSWIRLYNNYEIQIPIYRAASPKTQVVQFVLLGMQGVKSGEIREAERLFSIREPENKVDDNGH